MRYLITFLVLAGGVCLAPAAQAQLAEAPANGQNAAGEIGPEQFLALAEAYQSGLLQVAAVACLQLYSSSGIIATDFARGNIDAPTALYALDQNSLLHSACYTALAEVQALTPASDEVALYELGRLLGLLTTEEALLSALADVFGEPTAEHEAAAEAARAEVEAALDVYINPAGPAV